MRASASQDASKAEIEALQRVAQEERIRVQESISDQDERARRIKEINDRLAVDVLEAQ